MKAMHSTSKKQVLRGFRPFARTLAIYNLDNFRRTHDRRSIRHNLLRAIACSALFSSLIATAAMNAWPYFALEQNWNERAYHLVIMLCVVQQMCIFASMTRRNRQILETLEQLQRTVDNRKHLYVKLGQCATHIFLLGLIASIHSPFSLPPPPRPVAERSRKHDLYDVGEQRYASAHAKVRQTCVVSVVTLYMLPLLQPVSYAIFHQPQLSDWVLPCGFR